MSSYEQAQRKVLAVRVSQSDAEKMGQCIASLPDDMQLDRNILVFPRGTEVRAVQIGVLLRRALDHVAPQAQYAGVLAVHVQQRYFNAPSSGFPEQRPIITFSHTYALHVECWNLAAEAIAEVNENYEDQAIEQDGPPALQISTTPLEEKDWYF